MEVSRNSADKVMERLTTAERKHYILNEQMKAQDLKLEIKRQSDLVDQEKQLKQQKHAALAEQRRILEQEIRKNQLEIERQIKMRQYLKKTFSWRVTAPIRSLPCLVRPGAKN